jgi:hypothetical protein
MPSMPDQKPTLEYCDRPGAVFELPEFREMVSAGREYVSYLVGPATHCAFWAKVHRVHPAIKRLADDWSLWLDQRWNEHGRYKESMSEVELRRRIAADLGIDIGPPASPAS